jgi:hypothetical protein
MAGERGESPAGVMETVITKAKGAFRRLCFRRRARASASLVEAWTKEEVEKDGRKGRREPAGL